MSGQLTREQMHALCGLMGPATAALGILITGLDSIVPGTVVCSLLDANAQALATYVLAPDGTMTDATVETA